MSLIKPVSGRLTVHTTWPNRPHVRTWKFESSVVKFGRLSKRTVRPQRSDRLQFNFRHPPETLVSLIEKLQGGADCLHHLDGLKASTPLVGFGVLIDNTIKRLTCLYEIMSKNLIKKLVLNKMAHVLQASVFIPLE